MILKKRRVCQYIIDRFVRLFLPIIVFAYPLSLILSAPPWTIHHLWFLYYLTIFSMAYGILFWVNNKFSMKYLILIVRWPGKRLGTLPIYLIPVIFLFYTSHSVYGQTIFPVHFLDLKLGSLMYFFIWFIFGCIIFEQEQLLDRIKETPVVIIFFVCAVVFLMVYFTTFDRAITGDQFWIIVRTIGGGIATFCWSFFLVGLTNRIITQSNQILQFFVQASYPVYLLHLGIVFYVGSALVWGSDGKYNNLNLDLAVLLNIFISLILSIALYFALIKYTPLNWIVNGYKNSWFKFPMVKTVSLDWHRNDTK